MKTLKTFIKPFEAPQRSVKIKIQVNFYFNTTFWNAQDEKGYAFTRRVRFMSLTNFSSSFMKIVWMYLTDFSY